MKKFLEFLSAKVGVSIHEHWKPRWFAIAVSWIIWRFVELVAQAIGDRSRVMDVRGQRALALREAGRRERSLQLLNSCVELAQQSADPWKIQVYLSERAVVLSMLERYAKAEEDTIRAVTIARNSAAPDLCRRLTLLGRVYAGGGKAFRAQGAFWEAMEIALKPDHPVAHPSHRVGALLSYAQFMWQQENRSAAWEWLNRAKEMAHSQKLQRRLEEIETLERTWRAT